MQKRLTGALKGEDTFGSLFAQSPSSGMQRGAPFVPFTCQSKQNLKGTLPRAFIFRVRKKMINCLIHLL